MQKAVKQALQSTFRRFIDSSSNVLMLKINDEGQFKEIAEYLLHFDTELVSVSVKKDSKKVIVRRKDGNVFTGSMLPLRATL